MASIAVTGPGNGPVDPKKLAAAAGVEPFGPFASGRATKLLLDNNDQGPEFQRCFWIDIPLKPIGGLVFQFDSCPRPCIAARLMRSHDLD